MNAKICLAQMEVKPGRPRENTDKMILMINEAKSNGVDIIVFPEMAIPGYMLGDMWERKSFLKECEACGEEIRAASKGMFETIVVIFGNVAVDWDKRNEDSRVRKYNALFVAEDGEWNKTGAYPWNYHYRIKTLMPDYREFDDNRHFYSFAKYLASEEMDGRYSHDNPFEPYLLKNGLRLGCMLCEDGWDEDYSISPIDELGDNGCDLFVNISCSPFTYGKNARRNKIFSDKCKAWATPMVYVNCVGIQDNGKTVYTFDGQSCIYDIDGDQVDGGSPFVERASTFNINNLNSSFGWVAMSHYDDIGKLYEAVRYGTEKFMERFGIDQVVIGASGGIDSALVAAIMSDILPKENIHLVNMPSKYNSKTTKNLASELASNIGCSYSQIPITPSVEVTESQMKDCDFPLSEHDMENVQARDRSSRILAAVASSVGGVFTCNANKTEMTVGYTTMLGDLAGFLAPISDLWKTQVYEMAKWFNVNVKNVIPQGSMDIVPSAELSDKQDVDEGEGDPIQYHYHDKLFASWVERWDRATPEDVLEWYGRKTIEQELGLSLNTGSIEALFANDPKLFVEDLERWWNAYQGLGVSKRIVAPPVMAVSRRAFGFDHREAQMGVWYSERYAILKEKLLS